MNWRSLPSLLTLFALVGCSMGQTPLVFTSLQVADLLQCGGFECGFREVDGVGELKVANGWLPWYTEGGGLHRPEYKPEQVGVGKGRVYQGEYAAKQFTTYAKQDGGIYQVVDGIVPGNWYKFSCWAYVWSSNKDDPDISTQPGKYSVLVGINSWGDTRAIYRTTVWGKEALEQYDKWVNVSVTAEAWSNRIVVFTRGEQIWAVKHGDSYFDACELHRIDVSICPTPYPTPIPYPTCPPGTSDCPSLEEIRETIRTELDRTRLTY